MTIINLSLVFIGSIFIVIGANGNIYYDGKRDWPFNISVAVIGIVLYIAGIKGI